MAFSVKPCINEPVVQCSSDLVGAVNYRTWGFREEVVEIDVTWIRASFCNRESVPGTFLRRSAFAVQKYKATKLHRIL